MMTDDLSWVPPGVDTGRANVARVYDYWLGGSHNFLADQDVARAIAAVDPTARDASPGPTARSSAGRSGSWPRTASASSWTSARAFPPRATCTRSPSRPTRLPGCLRGHRPGRRGAQQGHAGRATRTPRSSRRTCANRGKILDQRYGPPADRPGPAGRAAARLRPAFHRRRRGPLAASWRRCATRWRPAATWCSPTAPTRTGPAWPRGREGVQPQRRHGPAPALAPGNPPLLRRLRPGGSRAGLHPAAGGPTRLPTCPTIPADPGRSSGSAAADDRRPELGAARASTLSGPTWPGSTTTGWAAATTSSPTRMWPGRSWPSSPTLAKASAPTVRSSAARCGTWPRAGSPVPGHRLGHPDRGQRARGCSAGQPRCPRRLRRHRQGGCRAQPGHLDG